MITNLKNIILKNKNDNLKKQNDELIKEIDLLHNECQDYRLKWKELRAEIQEKERNDGARRNVLIKELSQRIEDLENSNEVLLKEKINKIKEIESLHELEYTKLKDLAEIQKIEAVAQERKKNSSLETSIKKLEAEKEELRGKYEGLLIAFSEKEKEIERMNTLNQNILTKIPDVTLDISNPTTQNVTVNQ